MQNEEWKILFLSCWTMRQVNFIFRMQFHEVAVSCIYFLLLHMRKNRGKWTTFGAKKYYFRWVSTAFSQRVNFSRSGKTCEKSITMTPERIQFKHRHWYTRFCVFFVHFLQWNMDFFRYSINNTIVQIKISPIWIEAVSYTGCIGVFSIGAIVDSYKIKYPLLSCSQLANHLIYAAFEFQIESFHSAIFLYFSRRFTAVR